MRQAGEENRRRMVREKQEQERKMRSAAPAALPPGATVPPPEPFAQRQAPSDPFDRRQAAQRQESDPSKEQNPGVVMGIAMSNYRKADGEEHFRVLPGEDVQLTSPPPARRPRP